MTTASIELKDARIQTLLAESEAHRQQARNFELKNEGLERELKQLNALSENFNEYMFYNPVVEQTTLRAMVEMGMWSRQRPNEPMTVTFNSPGGYVTDGFTLFDFLRDLASKGHPITTKCMGIAASMGAILMQAGDERVMTPNAFLMIHEVSGGGEGKVSELEEITAVTKQFQKRGLKILAERSTMTEAAIAKRWRKRDWYMSADEALKAGFIDRIEGV